MARKFLIEDAVVWAGGRPSPQPGYIAVQDGVIAGLGDGPPPHMDERRALGGRHVLPGFIDAHSHLTVSAWLPRALDAGAWDSAAAALAEIARHRAGRPAGTWVVALGADFDRWSDGLPRSDDLDAAAGGYPAVIADFSLHRCLASSEARRLGGIAGTGVRATEDVVMSRGRPSGLLWEGACARVLAAAFTAMANELGAVGHRVLLAEEAQRHLALGITTCHDPCVPASMQPMLERVRQETPLRLSWSSVAEEGLLEPADVAELCATCGEGPPSAKLFMDGAHKCALCLDPRHVLKMMGATAVAAMRGNLAPLHALFAYRSVYRAGRVYTPYLRMDTGVLSRRLERLAMHGIRPRIHAVGNHAASCVCASLTDTALRNVTVEHLTFLGDREIDAVAATGAVASLQPGFIERFGASILDRRLVPDLRAYPAASLLRAGVPLALSSDNPCGPLDPLGNIRAAVERRLADGRMVDMREAVTIEEAVAAYTLGGYHAVHGVPGHGLSINAAADFVVLDGHPALATSRVVETWIGGELAWSMPS
jgi:predicted amidohydrolase YtcJ